MKKISTRQTFKVVTGLSDNLREAFSLSFPQINVIAPRKLGLCERTAERTEKGTFPKIIRCPRVCHLACRLENIGSSRSGSLAHGPGVEHNTLLPQGRMQAGVGKKPALKHQIPTTDQAPGRITGLITQPTLGSAPRSSFKIC